VFIGEYHHTIDEKGRVTIPSRFREALGDRFVATRGLDNCVFVYPLQEWANLEGKLKSLPFTKADSRVFARFFFSGASECEVDRQGRTLLPPGLREYAHLEKEVVIIGVSNRVEIWSRAEWEAYSRKANLNFEEIAEKLVEL